MDDTRVLVHLSFQASGMNKREGGHRRRRRQCDRPPCTECRPKKVRFTKSRPSCCPLHPSKKLQVGTLSGIRARVPVLSDQEEMVDHSPNPSSHLRKRIAIMIFRGCVCWLVG
jgi:hypothetical protein